MGAEDGRSPETDAYGWPQDESSPPSSAAEVKIVSSILPAIELRGLELTPLATGQEHFIYTSALPPHASPVDPSEQNPRKCRGGAKWRAIMPAILPCAVSLHRLQAAIPPLGAMAHH